MAPTAISPPYFKREELKHTEITLSLACIINVASPKAIHGIMILSDRRIFLSRILSPVFFDSKKHTAQTHDTP